MVKIVVFGIRRGGNHAINNWLLPQFKGGVEHYDNYRKDNPQYIKYGGGESKLFGVEDSSLHFEEWDDFKKVIIIRNPWNLIASHNMWKGRIPLYKRKNLVVKLWNEYYEEYLKEEHVFIVYDKWFGCIGYRKQISKALGLEFTDENLNQVINAGRGSSFDGVKMDGNAQEMNVLNRYEEVNNYSMTAFKESEVGQEMKNKWNHLCDLENIKELKID